jgi:putative Mn2+ efflux pump MntP
MNWLKKHADSVSVIVVVVGATWIISGLVHRVEKRSDEKTAALEKSIDSRFFALEKSMDSRFVALEKDVNVIKTIVTMGNHSQRQLAKQTLSVKDE